MNAGQTQGEATTETEQAQPQMPNDREVAWREREKELLRYWRQARWAMTCLLRDAEEAYAEDGPYAGDCLREHARRLYYSLGLSTEEWLVRNVVVSWEVDAARCALSGDERVATVLLQCAREIEEELDLVQV